MPNRWKTSPGARAGRAGLGLYRTEFLFLQRNELPDEEEQFQTYRDAALGMSGRPVTIRTLDLGADKADRTGLTLSNEENPALGLRGVRLSLARPKVADTQLRAILRASAYGKLRVLVPMVSTREELLAVRRRMLKLTEQLRGEGHMVSDHVPLGAMIEVPAAALALESFIDPVDFLSIGTNDRCSTCWPPTATTRHWANCIRHCIRPCCDCCRW